MQHNYSGGDGVFPIGGSSARSVSSMSLASAAPSGGWIVLNVGGKEFRTTKRSMLREPGSLFGLMVDPPEADLEVLYEEADERIFLNGDVWNIDSDEKVFETVLKYLRNGKLIGKLADGVTEEDLKTEAEFFRLPKLMQICDQRMSERDGILRQWPSNTSMSSSTLNASQMGVSLAAAQSPLFVPQQFVSAPPPGIQQPPAFVHSQQSQQQQQLEAPPPGFDPSLNTPPGFASQNFKFNGGGGGGGLSPRSSKINESLTEAQNARLTSSSLSSTAISKNQSQSSEINLGAHIKPEGTQQVHIDVQSAMDQQWKAFSEMPQKREAAATAAEESDECFVEERAAAEQQQQQEEAIVHEAAAEQHDDYEEGELDEGFSPSAAGDVAADLAFDVASTAFEPPGLEGVVRRLPQTLCFVSLDGVVLNYEMAFTQKQSSVEKFLKLLDAQPSWDRGRFDRFPNFGAILFALQRLYQRHPDGCTVKEYIEFENEQKRVRPTQEQFIFNNTMPTVVSLLQAGDLLKIDKSDGRLFVAEEVARTQLFCLTKNFCSNLYRKLLAAPGNAMSVQQLLQIAPKMVPKGMQIGADSFIGICNRYPAVFQLICSEQEQCTVMAAKIALNKQLVERDVAWRVVLDCDFPSGGDENVCDCVNCSPPPPGVCCECVTY